MSSVITGGVNGRQRQTLAHQLDRLDAILDGLADALNGAVADAVRDAVAGAVAAAVRAAVTEVLANPVVAATVAAATPNTVAARPTGWAWLAARFQRARAALAAAAGRVREWKQRATARAAAALRPVVWRVRAAAVVARVLAGGLCIGRRTWLTALAAGVVVGIGSYLAGPVAAGLVSGAFAAGVTVATGVVTRLVKVARWRLVM